MARELKIRFSFEYQKGNGKVHKVRSTQKITVTGNNVKGLSVQPVAITKGNLIKPVDMATVGWVYLHNMDTTNYVEFGDDADNPSIKLKAGEETFVRWGATNVSAKANTAGCDVEYLMIED